MMELQASINGTVAVGNTLTIKEDSADPDGTGLYLIVGHLGIVTTGM